MLVPVSFMIPPINFSLKICRNNNHLNVGEGASLSGVWKMHFVNPARLLPRSQMPCFCLKKVALVMTILGSTTSVVSLWRELIVQHSFAVFIQFIPTFHHTSLQVLINMPSSKYVCVPRLHAMFVLAIQAITHDLGIFQSKGM